jgi:hypothetical protein
MKSMKEIEGGQGYKPVMQLRKHVVLESLTFNK